MGYPMTFTRFIRRNGLADYKNGYGTQIEGDLNRWVNNSQDHAHIEYFSKISGATEDQVRLILAVLLDPDRNVTMEGIPLQFFENGTEYDPVKMAALAADLTLRADRKKIAELEQWIRDTDDNFHRIFKRLKFVGREVEAKEGVDDVDHKIVTWMTAQASKPKRETVEAIFDYCAENVDEEYDEVQKQSMKKDLADLRDWILKFV